MILTIYIDKLYSNYYNEENYGKQEFEEKQANFSNNV